MHRNILIPVALDHEKMVPRKLALARHLLEPGGTITLMTVLESVPGFVAEFVTVKAENHLVKRIHDRLIEVAGGAADVRIVVDTGKAGVRLAQYAEENAIDLIVIGSHQPGIQDYFLGSTAARVARRAPCSVYILR